MRHKLECWLPKGSIFRGAAVLTGGTAFAQGLMVLALPLLTRLYSPQDFSLLAVYAAIIGIVTVASCMRYDIAIPLPEDDLDGMALLFLAVLAAFAVSFLCALPVVLAPEATSHLIGQPTFQPYLWMIPLGVFIASVYNALQYWASRKKRFGLVARTRMTQATGGIGTQISIGATTSLSIGLIFGQMLNGGLGIWGLARDLWRQDRAVLSRVDAARLYFNASNFRRFPIWSVPEALFNSAGVQVPVILIAAVATGPEAGFLMLAMRVMGMPMRLVGRSVSQVFLSEAPAKLRDGTLAAFTRSTMWALFRSGAPLLVGLGVVSPLLFPLVFGAEWERAGWLVMWMTPWFVLSFVTSPASMVLHVTGRVAIAMLLQAFGLVLRVGLVLFAAWMETGFVAEIFALSGALFYSLYLAVILFYVSKITP